MTTKIRRILVVLCLLGYGEKNLYRAPDADSKKIVYLHIIVCVHVDCVWAVRVSVAALYMKWNVTENILEISLGIDFVCV